MGDFISMLGSMSVQASIIIIVVIAIRKLFELLHIEKKYMMLLWIIPFFCLICPYKISVPYGFWQNAPADVSSEQEENLSDVNESDIRYESTVNEDSADNNDEVIWEVVSPDYEPDNSVDLINAKDIILKELMNIMPVVIWLIGVIALFVWNYISYRKLKEKLLCSEITGENIYRGEGIPTPMVFGFFKPCIYLPLGLPDEYEKYVLAHENTHIKRFDNIYKLVIYGIACIHWFNPIVWLGFYLFNKDMEMSCDEVTVLSLGSEEKEAYAKALLGVATQKNFKEKLIFVAPIAFEEGNVKKRIINIVNFRKTLKVLGVLAVAICIVVAGIFISKEKIVTAKEIVESEREINAEAFKAYTAFIREVEAAITDDFQSVSADELNISSAFGGGIDMTMYNIGYEIMDTNSDGVLELLFMACVKCSTSKVLYDSYEYVDGKIVHTYSSPVGKDFSAGEFYKFAVSQEPRDTATETPATESPVTEAPDATATENATIVDMQILDMNSSAVAEAFEAYKAVFKNETSMVQADDGERILIKDLNESLKSTNPNIISEFTSFAIIDLDSNGIPEVVLQHQNIPVTEGRIVGEDEDIQDIGCYILRYSDGKVYSYYKYNKAFDELKIDGFFNSSGDITNHGWCKLYFSGNQVVVDEIDYVEAYYWDNHNRIVNFYVNKSPASEESFNKQIKYHSSKPDVTWYIYSEDNIDKCFKIISSEDKLRNMTYGKALWNAYQKGVMPDGRELDWSATTVFENSFAVYDVDNDGSEELIIKWDARNNAMVSIVESMYDFKNNSLNEQYSRFASNKYYDNGVIINDSSHNQGRGTIIWPYSLYVYDKNTDTYKSKGQVDSWSKKSHPENFPDDIDKDGDGHVYDLPANNGQGYQQYARERLVDGAEYEQWINSYLDGANEINIPYQPLTEEKIEALGAPRVYEEPSIPRG